MRLCYGGRSRAWIALYQMVDAGARRYRGRMSEPRDSSRELVVFEGEGAEEKAVAWNRRRLADVLDKALAPIGLRVDREALDVSEAS
jgi:hypothetical protein